MMMMKKMMMMMMMKNMDDDSHDVVAVVTCDRGLGIESSLAIAPTLGEHRHYKP